MATIEERIYDANRAKEVLENPAFQEAFSAIENEVIEQWKTSPARAEADREKLWVYLSMLNKLKAHLETTLQTGKLAQLEVEHRQTLAQRVGSALFPS